MQTKNLKIDRRSLERLYDRFNHRSYVSPDPLELVLQYDDIADREIVALIASSLAYGRVSQILRSVSAVLDDMKAPSRFLRRSSPAHLRRKFAGFKHRFTTGDEVAALLIGIRRVIGEYGSLAACFESGMCGHEADTFDPLCRFALEIRKRSRGGCATLLPCPENGSACKRLNLFLKWMVRKDEVDPGGWDGIDKSMLIMPLDTHVHRIGKVLGLTTRRQADLKTAREITAAFRKIAPEDPTKYDFALTRLGMKYGVDIADHLNDHLRLEGVKYG